MSIFGWVPNREGCRDYTDRLMPTGDFWDRVMDADDGGDRYSYRALLLCLQGCEDWVKRQWITADGRIRSYDQGNIGSCVGHGEAKRAAYNAALDIHLRLEQEQFVAMFSPEAAYALSREESGMLGRGDGSTGYGAAQANTKHGALLQGVYGGFDVREYSVSTCRDWGRRGLPSELRDETKRHRSAQYVKVDTAEKCWAMAGLGIPWNQCSSLGWADPVTDDEEEIVRLMAAGAPIVGQERDADGALKRRGSWMHSMTAGAARRTTASGRKLILIDNSWGDNWVGGGYYLDQPAGSFYADLDDVAAAASQDDTFADLGYMGLERPVPGPDDLSFLDM